MWRLLSLAGMFACARCRTDKRLGFQSHDKGAPCRPLLVIGKGAAYSQADAALRTFVERAGLPFLATAMGRGVVPDTHGASANAARSLALAKADVAIVFGARCALLLGNSGESTAASCSLLGQQHSSCNDLAKSFCPEAGFQSLILWASACKPVTHGVVMGRLNWQLHFGEPPKWSACVKFILVDVEPSQRDADKAALVLRGDAAAVAEQLCGALQGLKGGRFAPWRQQLSHKACLAPLSIVPEISPVM